MVLLCSGILLIRYGVAALTAHFPLSRPAQLQDSYSSRPSITVRPPMLHGPGILLQYGSHTSNYHLPEARVPRVL